MMTIDGHLTPVAPQRHATPQTGRPPESVRAGAASSVAPTGPSGVTPELWNSLNADEQAFFAAASVRGPLTYGPTPASGTDQTQSRGHHIDVRV